MLAGRRMWVMSAAWRMWAIFVAPVSRVDGVEHIAMDGAAHTDGVVDITVEAGDGPPSASE